MSVSGLFGVGFTGASTNNPFITTPQGMSPAKPQRDTSSVRLANPQPADTFTLQTAPPQKSYSEKVFSNFNDRLLTRFLPEKFVTKYVNKEFLQKAAENNPRIKQMLTEHNLDVKIEPQNVTNIVKNHLVPTMVYAKEIMDKSGEYFTPDDYEKMAQAALLHDIGKSLIPSEILNKKETLTKEEREIIKMHSELGYELLKSSNLSPKVLKMVKNHHDYGQPHVKDSMTQILTVADIYSALKENRSYKKAMSNEEAFSILDKNSSNGEFAKSYVSALKNSQNFAQPKKENQELAIA